MARLLVVDDELDVCDFVKSFFEERGFEVFTAQDGMEAMRIIQRTKIDTMLLDVRMRGMDGIEALKKIREMDKNIKVIMVTAVDEQGKIDEAMKLGAIAYVTKPLVLETLESTVMLSARGAAKNVQGNRQ